MHKIVSSIEFCCVSTTTPAGIRLVLHHTTDRLALQRILAPHHLGVTGQLKCDGTRTEPRFRLSAKRTSPFKSAGASVQSTTGSRGVRISGSNA